MATEGGICSKCGKCIHTSRGYERHMNQCQVDYNIARVLNSGIPFVENGFKDFTVPLNNNSDPISDLAQWKAFLKAMPVVLRGIYPSSQCKCRETLPRPLPPSIIRAYNLLSTHTYLDHYIHTLEVCYYLFH